MGRDMLPDVKEEDIDDMTQEEAEQLLVHLQHLNEMLDRFTDEARFINMKTFNEAVVDKAAELLAQEYVEAEEYGEREAEIAAVVMCLDVDLDFDTAWQGWRPNQEEDDDT